MLSETALAKTEFLFFRRDLVLPINPSAPWGNRGCVSAPCAPKVPASSVVSRASFTASCASVTSLTSSASVKFSSALGLAWVSAFRSACCNRSSVFAIDLYKLARFWMALESCPVSSMVTS
jgi:hypothetical protein